MNQSTSKANYRTIVPWIPITPEHYLDINIFSPSVHLPQVSDSSILQYIDLIINRLLPVCVFWAAQCAKNNKVYAVLVS